MKRFILLVFTAAGLFLTFCCESPALAADNPVEQWARFEQNFTSSKNYDNPVQQIKLKVEFTSPSGNKRTLLAFWDGDRVWRVRFSPDEQGDLLVVYLPEGGSVTLKTDSLKKGLTARRYHPRTGGWLDAGNIDKSPQTFKTADLNDWILLIEAKLND